MLLTLSNYQAANEGALSIENALLAQNRIPAFLIELWIRDYRVGSAFYSAKPNSSKQRTSSAFSDATDFSFNNNTPRDPINRITSPMRLYQFDDPSMASSLSLAIMESNTSFVNTALTAAFDRDIRSLPI